MRNDARPIGHDNSRKSPVVSHEVVSHQSEVVGHQSDVVGHQSGGHRRQLRSTADDRLPDLLDLDGDDPVMPADDATLMIRI
jgi:hypothetical protein